MRYLLQMLCLFTVIFSPYALSEWQYQPDDVPKVAEVAISISKEVDNIPEPLFMTSTDKTKVRQLLNATLSEQQTQGETFSKHLSAYVESFGEEQWLDVESSYLTLTSISYSKQRLLKLSTSKRRDALTGFGPYGVTQFKQEWTLTQLNARYALYFQLRSFKSLISDLLISPIPVIWSGTKVFFTYLILMWWLANSTRLIQAFKTNILDAQAMPPVWVRLIWYISRANKALAWLIAITLSLRILSEIPSLQHLIYLEIFTWWVLGGSIAISFILEFTYRNSRSSNKEMVALRLSTIRRYVWSVIIAGVILQISVRTLGEGTIYNWIYSVLFFWFVLVTLSVLRLWRPIVFEAISCISERPWWVNWAISKKDILVLRIVATAIAAVWVIIHNFKLRIISGLSNFTIFSQALAYLFKIEVEKQKSITADNQQLVRVRGNKAFEYILPGSDYSELIDYGNAEVKELSKYLLTDSPAICVVSGERGVGTTTLLKQILHKAKNAEPLYLNCPYAGYPELLAHFAVSLGLDEESTEIQVLAHLRSSETTYILAFDNAQRLVKPMVGGLSSLIRLTNLLRRSRKNHRAVIAIEKASWRFVDRARGERLLFDWVTFLPKWTEAQIQSLLDTRINQSDENTVSFEGLMVPKQWDQQDISEEQRAKQGFYRILWHYSDGNPTVALRFFRLSLNRHKETDQVFVRLFYAPESEELEKMPKPMLAVLRSIVQLEIASPEELSECTQLTIAEVVGTLRYFQSRGFIEWSEDKARVSDHWFRHITNVLDRQHLLVK
ncbi:ATP-binding protein [Vibrio makurazakiensis]|uniref:ATP-binding protein n=1 Tax=Vibrio makurazakiensis TaxID=2910250 RepID=UPI003D0CE324